MDESASLNSQDSKTDSRRTFADTRAYFASYFAHRVSRLLDGKRREQIRVLALVAALTLVGAAALWGGYRAYLSVAGYFSPEAQEAREAAKANEAARAEAMELAQDEEEKAAAKKYWEDAQTAMRVNQAKFAADRYQWQTWKHTLQDIKENNIRMQEKQRIAEEEEAERLRLDRIRKEAEAKKAQEAAKRAAEAAVKARPQSQIRTRKTLRSF